MTDKQRRRNVSGLTTEMIRNAVYDEYGSMFIDVAKEFEAWMDQQYRRMRDEEEAKD